MNTSSNNQPSSEVTLKWMELCDLGQIAQIDRTELLDMLYSQSGFQISAKPVDTINATWSSVPKMVEFCRCHMRSGAEALGAFDEELLVGIGLMTPNIQPQVAQLSFLHVSNRYRRRGLATRLMNGLMPRAKKSGHGSVYVTASPTKSAVSFYRNCGFAPTDRPIQHLLELEPDDIHMVASL